MLPRREAAAPLSACLRMRIGNVSALESVENFARAEAESTADLIALVEGGGPRVSHVVRVLS